MVFLDLFYTLFKEQRASFFNAISGFFEKIIKIKVALIIN